MSDLLVSFAAAGGAPPASNEVVQVFRDGGVRALAGTAWPGHGRADEAGVYALALDGQRLSRLAALAGDARLDDAGPLEPDSGRFVVQVADRRLEWTPSRRPPDSLATLAARLGELMAEAREHPLAAVRLSLGAPAPHLLIYTFASIGREAVTLSVPAQQVRARANLAPGGPPAGPPPLSWVRQARPVITRGGGPLELAPAATLTITAEAPDPPGEPGPYRVDGFAAVDLGLPGGQRLDATLAAGPVVPPY